ncbi:hypothetical protein F4780DRAFT_745622, partial [Xylariomycetidae sp. FL0641]
MTATPPPQHRLWHPARGISFSPTPSYPSLPDLPVPRVEHGFSLNERTAGANPTSGSILHATSPDNASRSEAGEATSFSEDVARTDTTAEAEDTPEKASDHPPCAPLPFKMVEELFYAAKKAPAGSPESFWSYTHYRGPNEDGDEAKPKVH